ncbi:Protein MOR1 [Tetrabaena socialis]|uniref:Protein MOR1 n=1 Tax=Tetrabaena socialis TaxID=47790 RepID=A0A2J8AJA1_9CHLO|nr:Protein MOR1 [Tetrabaena socialis]|eukprot:PNH12606.1 Protein MOR1 [Tetrabaena socialis]
MSDDKDVRELTEAKKLPLADRIAHTNWKARVAAYEDICVACKEIYDESDPRLAEYAPLFAKAVAESNAAAVDKALDALAAFLSKATEQQASRICERVCSTMVAKCLSARTSTLTRALEAMLFFVELEQADKVTESLIVGLTNKNPKVVVAALELLYHTINHFGHRVVTPNPILKALPALFESKDGKAREKVKEIVVEMSRWMGADAVRTLLFSKMRDAMRDDINRAMELVEPAKQPQRLTRKQQVKAAEMLERGVPAAEMGPATGSAAAVAVQEELPPQADPYDYAEPKKVLGELKHDVFWDKLEEKKWTERRDALLLLKSLADTPRIASGDYGDVIRELRKLVSKDSNVVVVAEAINCCGLLAKGLRKEFASAARNMAGQLLEKLKEKNSNVGNAVTGTLTFMHKYCWSLLDVQEDLTEAMGHANPKVKEDTYKWLAVAVSQEGKANMKQLVAPLMGIAAKGAEEALPALREAAMAFMAAFTVRFGNPAILDKFCSKMDEGRKKKLQEMVAEAMGGGAAAGPGSSAATSGGAAAAAQASRAPAPSLSLKSRLGPTSRPATAAKASSTTAPAASTSGASKKAAAGGDADDEASLGGGAMSRDQAVAALTDLMGEATVKELQDEQWKIRLDAMERVASRAGEPATAASSGSMLVQAMSHLPGWGEKNFQVMAKQFEVLRAVAASCPTFGKREAFACITGLIDKMADMKLKQPSFDTLTSLAEAVGPQFVMVQLHKKTAVHKNPKVQSEALAWVSRAITDFGIAGADVRALLEWTKEDLGSANAGVRNAAIQLLGIMYRYLGPPLGDMIRADIKPALMTAIDGEFAKNEGVPKPEPTRVSRVAAPARAGGGGGKGAGKGGGGGGVAAGGGGGGAAAGAFDADDLLPRTDISGMITSELVVQLSNANWKERKAGLDTIEAIVTQAGNRIQPQTGDLLPELKKRLTDSNKNLTTQALTVLGRIAKAMGRAIDRQGRQLLAPAVKNITDQKQTVRSAVVEMLDAWIAVTNPGCVMPDVMEFFTSAKITADGKAETLKWLAALVSGGRVGESVAEALRAGALGNLDKAAEVRDAATKLMVALVEVVGPAELAGAAHGLDAASRKAAIEAISKVTGAPVPVAAAAAAAAASTSGRPAASSAVRSSTTSLRASTASLPKATGAAARPSTAKAGSIVNRSMSSAGMAALMAAGDGGPIIQPDNKKEDRAKKGRYRPTKLQIMPDEAQTLEAEFSHMLSPALKAAAFNKDFKKHCEAADMITRAMPGMFDEVIAVVDLLFRWSTLRILESNTASLVKVLEMLKLLLELMIERGYRVSEFEAKLILPALVEKAGHNQDKLKAEHRELLKRLALVHPPSRVISYIKDGLESKNSKTRVVCMDEIAAMVDRYGPAAYRAPAAAGPSGRPGTAAAAASEGVMPAVAKLVAERDTAVRAACLGVIEVVYCIEGTGIWEVLGRLSDQQKSLIEERIKAAGNRLARAGQQPGYKAAEYGLPVQEDVVPPSPAAANGAPRRPASPMRRSGIGLGSSAGGAAVAASPVARGGILDGGFGARSAALPVAEPSSPAPVHPAVVEAVSLSYADRNAGSPLLSRYGSLNTIPTQLVGGGGAGVLTSLEGAGEEGTMRNWVILHDRLQGKDEESAIQAMKLLCYSYMEMDKHSSHVARLLTDPRNVEEMVHLLSARVDQSFADAAASTVCLSDGPVYNARACKYSVNSLMNLCNVTANSLSDASLQKLFSVLLACLIDVRLRQVPDGDGLLKAVNMLIMKLLEHARRSGVFGALIGLLRVPNPRIYGMAHAGGADGGASEMLLRWNDMVVKCLIKMTKQLGSIIPTIAVGQVLVHIHRYMQELGADEVRRRSSLEDKPLRMVKTMLHELCKHRGYDIYRDVEAMPDVTEHEDEMVMLPYIRLNLDTLHIDKRPQQQHPSSASGFAAPAATTGTAVGVVGASALASQPRPVSELPSAPAPAARARGIPTAAGADFKPPPLTLPTAAAPAPAAAVQQPHHPQVLAPLSTNAMSPPPNGTSSAGGGKATIAPAPVAVTAAPPPNGAAPPAAAPAPQTPLNLEPSSREFTLPAADEQVARNILATIFKRIGDKAQSNQALVDLHHFIEANPNIDVLNQMLSQVSPYFKTYLQRGLSKVRLQIQHAATAAAAAAAAAQEQPIASPAPAVAGVSGSSWGSPDGEATVAAGGPTTIAEKLAAAEAQASSPMSPGRLRGVGNLDELRNRMNSLSTNLNDLPVRSSTAAATGAGAMSQELMDLQERMKKIQNIAAVMGPGA